MTSLWAQEKSIQYKSTEVQRPQKNGPALIFFFWTIHFLHFSCFSKQSMFDKNQKTWERKKKIEYTVLIKHLTHSGSPVFLSNSNSLQCAPNNLIRTPYMWHKTLNYSYIMSKAFLYLYHTYKATENILWQTIPQKCNHSLAQVRN